MITALNFNSEMPCRSVIDVLSTMPSISASASLSAPASIWTDVDEVDPLIRMLSLDTDMTWDVLDSDNAYITC